jgi:hypothetical protein
MENLAQFNTLNPDQKAKVLAFAREVSPFWALFDGEDPRSAPEEFAWLLDQLTEDFKWRQQREATRMDV